ncbi:MAG TPA: hypothetical protein VNI61_01125 [Gemmatimonadales bacterium]|nr:hypothetical protein [Gemmatimonadales bacterium]
MELPASHRLPLSWLLEAASAPIQYRAYREVVPEEARDPERLEALRAAVLEYKPALAIARKQKVTGLWGANLLAPAPLKAYGWKETGTVYQYRRLLELGWPADHRVLRTTERFLFQLLSRIEPDDPDPELAARALALLVEFERAGRTDLGLARWARQLGREAAAAALARGGHAEDPRLRGAAHRIASDISQYLRSELAQKPFRKAQGKTVLDPAAYPPTIFAVEMLAFMPALQRERAGFVERLGQYFSSPAPKRAFFVLAGKRVLKPLFPLLGDPLGADARGRVPDIPFALYWLELLARLGLLRQVPSAQKVFAHLLAQCDAQGIWSPKNLRSLPPTRSPLVAHYYPLEGPGRSPAQRQTDVTFRLALIARLAGMAIEVV